MKFYYVYILQSQKDGKFYISLTTDLKRSVAQHRRREIISTKKRQPLKLVFYEAHRQKSDAARREKYFKTNKGKTTIKQVLRDYLKHGK